MFQKWCWILVQHSRYAPCCTEPPAFSIAIRADAETTHPLKDSFLSILAPPIIFIGGKRGPRSRIIPFSFKIFGVISVPSEKTFATRTSETGTFLLREGLTVRPRFLPNPLRFGSFLMISRISGRIL